MDKKSLTLFFVWCWFELAKKRAANAARMRALYPINREKVLASNRAYQAKNPERITAIKRRWYLRNRERLAVQWKEQYSENPEPMKARVRLWRKENKDRHQESRKRYYQRNYDKISAGITRWLAANRERRKSVQWVWRQLQQRSNPGWRIRKYLSKRVWAALRGISTKSARTLELLSCSASELKRHLELQFRPGMSWGNYGEWHVDHIRPCASFDLTDPEQQRACFNFKNLQPLWAKDNRSKGAKYAS